MKNAAIIIPNRRFLPKWQVLRCLLPVWVVVSIYSCNEPQTNYKDWYFPIENLTDGLVYIYGPADKPWNASQFWHISSVKTDSGWHLITKIYDESRTLRQEIREWEVPSGLIAQSYTLYTIDSMDRPLALSLEITKPNLFPYTIPDPSKVYAFQFKLKDPAEPGVVTTRTRYRRFKGMDSLSILNTTMASLVFALNEKVERDEEGRMTLEFNGEEVYAKGIGLAAWMQVPVPGDTVFYVLSDTMSLPTFNQHHGVFNQ